MNGIVNPASYPTFETIMNLVRVYLNDWQAGATDIPGEGQITTDDPILSPQTLPALNSAIREVYRELRLINAPTLIKDNIIVTLPPVSQFVSPPNPQVQVQLSPLGFFDGWQINNPPLLPADMLYPLEVWEQQANNGLPFVKMTQAEFGLQSRNQSFSMGQWEWRGDAIWMVGALCATTIRMRFLARFPTFFSPDLDFASTQVPIFDCEEAVAAKTAFKIARALSGMTPDVASFKQDAEEQMRQLKLAYVRRAQTIEYHRESYMDLGGSNYGSGSY